jgi:hypothetical protein
LFKKVKGEIADLAPWKNPVFKSIKVSLWSFTGGCLFVVSLHSLDESSGPIQDATLGMFNLSVDAQN